MSEKEAAKGNTGSDILDTAKEIADAGDVWFLSFARALGRTAGRLRTESDIVASSAKSAAATTSRITVKMMQRMKGAIRSDGGAAQKADGGTSEGLLKVVAKHYGVEETALRSVPDTREMIEFLHLRCVRLLEPVAAPEKVAEVQAVVEPAKPAAKPAAKAASKTAAAPAKAPEGT
jgi:hypothetical protein